MNDFLEETIEISKNEHTILVEKYRPATLDGYIGDKAFKEALASYIEKKDIPHLLFYNSSPGTGKTAAAKILYKNIPCDFLYINASDENGVGLIRDKIKGFASSAGFNPIKIIVLDECDQLSAEAQSALRNLIETYSLHTRFILTCNYVEKMIPPIVSRCQVFKVEAPPKKDVAMLLKNILDKESIIYTIEDLGYIVNTYYPDMRKIINFAQQSVTDGKLVINKHNAVDNDVKLKLLELLKTGIGNPATFNLIRQLVADSDIRFYDEFYSFLYQHTADFSRGKEVVAILIIAECVYQSALVVDREITFMSCIARLMKELK
jgi:DNA polymerase III delta prime subunit